MSQKRRAGKMQGQVFYLKLRKWAKKGLHESQEPGKEDYAMGRKSVFLALNNFFEGFESKL